MKVLTVFGTRPEAIKLAPVIRELAKQNGRVDSRVCITAQHREMLDQVLGLFNIIPDYDLDVMCDNQSPTQVAATVLSKLGPILEQERPDWVLIQGDTVSAAASALAAFYARSRVGHVEAGLRTFDKYHPFPEEINRRVAGVIADAHFAPTNRARDNLLREGVSPEAVTVTGNPVIDALYCVACVDYDPESGPLARIPWDKRLVMVTAHRRENFGEPLAEICRALRQIVRDFDGLHVLFPVHPNPHVQASVQPMLGNIPEITLTPPLEYLPFIFALKRSTLVLTDSGGVQEEAPALGKPVLVLRDVTERPEAVEAGTARIVGTRSDDILACVHLLLEDRREYEKMAHAVNPFGDGHAAERIVAELLEKR